MPDDRFNNLGDYSDIHRIEKSSSGQNRVYLLTSTF